MSDLKPEKLLQVNSDVSALFNPAVEAAQLPVFVLLFQSVLSNPLKPTCPVTEATVKGFLSMLP